MQEFDGRGGDPVLLGEVDLAAILDGGFERDGLQWHRAAVQPFEQPAPGEDLVVAADGLGRDVEFLGQRQHLYPAPGTGEFDDAALTGL